MTFVRVADTGVRPARLNVALTAALVELHGQGRIPDTLRFHRYPPSVLIGRHQALADAVRLDHCAREGLEIARRVSGGGAVYMTPGILAWDIVADRRRFGATVEIGGAMLCRAIAGGLMQLGVPARCHRRNEIALAGRKLCGAGGYVDGVSALYQGTVLVEVDTAAIDAALAPAVETSSHAARLITLADYLGHAPAMDAVMTALTAGLARARPDIAWRAGALGADELALADALHAAEIGTEDFVAGEDAAEMPPATALRSELHGSAP
ncbi:MAG: hypothetical protein EPO23_02865 [Xanthobacteraceae bacterium]|nr:MAG: hypothetical protein EPO23_02865 [Xanthobacteraceae bacterium]